jgi:lipopolysaccharide/colanic/teichoic acid biosynthesis glycosyltransferase
MISYIYNLKRSFDLFVILFLMPFLLLLLPLLCILVFFKLGSPIFFYQTRAGLNGKPFVLIKFRTMANSIDHTGSPLPDSDRLQSFGSFLRATSLDELPGLINVIKGDMSLVGPRPLLIEYVSRYSPGQARRLLVYPGITGWAQINGRNSISWDEKFKLDTWYVDNQSFLLDLKILFLTIKKVIARDGIAPPGEATMPIFYGKRDAE